MSFRIRFWPTFFTVLGLLLLITLGTWQLQRYQSASTFEEERDARMDEPVEAVDSPDQLLDRELDFRQIQVRGTWAPERLFLIKHRVFQGDPGFWVVRPLLIEGNEHPSYMLPVNQGWVSFADGQETAQQLLDETNDEPVEIRGLLHRLDDVVPDDQFRNSIDDETDLQGVIELESYDIEAINRTHEGPVFERPIVLTEAPDDASEESVDDSQPIPSYDHITTPYLTSDTHFGYMLTWYLLALALIAIWIAHGLGLLVSRAYDRR